MKANDTGSKSDPKDPNRNTDPTTGPVAVPTTDQAKGTFPKDAEKAREEQEKRQRREDERAKLAGEDKSGRK